MKVFLKIAFSLSLASFLWLAYEFITYKNAIELPYVTYTVINDSSKPYKVTIGYKTIHGMIFVDTTDKIWTASAYLPIGVSATLIAFPTHSLDNKEQDILDSNLTDDDDELLIGTQIISRDKTITDYSSRLSICSLARMEGK